MDNKDAMDKHLRINTAASRRCLARLRAFIPRHPDWITITAHPCICQGESSLNTITNSTQESEETPLKSDNKQILDTEKDCLLRNNKYKMKLKGENKFLNCFYFIVNKNEP